MAIKYIIFFSIAATENILIVKPNNTAQTSNCRTKDEKSGLPD